MVRASPNKQHAYYHEVEHEALARLRCAPKDLSISLTHALLEYITYHGAPTGHTSHRGWRHDALHDQRALVQHGRDVPCAHRPRQPLQTDERRPNTPTAACYPTSAEREKRVHAHAEERNRESDAPGQRTTGRKAHNTRRDEARLPSQQHPAARGEHIRHTFEFLRRFRRWPDAAARPQLEYYEYTYSATATGRGRDGQRKWQRTYFEGAGGCTYIPA